MIFRQAVVLKALMTIFSVMAISHPSFAQESAASCAKDKETSPEPVSGAKTAAAKLAKEPGGAALSGLIETWNTAREKCRDTNFEAQGECFEACSKAAQSGLSSANVLSGLMSAMGAMNATCGQANQAQNSMQNGYKSYTAKCTAAQASCKTACSGAIEKAAEIVKAATAIQCPPTSPTCPPAKASLIAAVEKDKGTEKTFVGGKNAQCNAEFTTALAGAGDVIKGLASVLGALAQKCGGDSSAANDGTNSPDAATQVPCTSLPAGSPELSSKRCVCELSAGHATGCGSSDAAAVPSTFSPSSTDIGKTDAADSSSDTGGAGNGNAQAAKAENGNSAGSPGSSGGGLMGGAGAAKTGDKAEAAAGKKADANILAGEVSGGGSGGGGGWGSMSESDKKASAAAASRAIASKAGIAAFTSSHGVTNWEKVKERYKDSRPTFLKDN